MRVVHMLGQILGHYEAVLRVAMAMGHRAKKTTMFFSHMVHQMILSSELLDLGIA